MSSNYSSLGGIVLQSSPARLIVILFYILVAKVYLLFNYFLLFFFELCVVRCAKIFTFFAPGHSRFVQLFCCIGKIYIRIPNNTVRANQERANSKIVMLLKLRFG